MKSLTKTTLLALLTTTQFLNADMDRCVSCHGVDFEKSALGVSKIVKNMTELEIKYALDGYKHGLGGSMKDLMIQEVNLGVDTDAMSADVYNEARTPGFDEPNDEFIFQKRLSVKTLHKLKTNIKKATKKDMNKISGQIESAAFTMYTYDTLLQSKVDFSHFHSQKLTKKDILTRVTKIKKCIDHSFSENEIVKCRIDFINLAGTLVKNKEKKMKSKMKKAPIYKGKNAVDISAYLHH